MCKIRYNSYAKRTSYYNVVLPRDTSELDSLKKKYSLSFKKCGLGSLITFSKPNIVAIEGAIKSDPNYIPFSKYLFEYFRDYKGLCPL